MRNVFRSIIRICFFTVVLSSATATAETKAAGSFSFESIIDKAKLLSTKAFDPEDGKISGDWLKINYDDFRNIRFYPEHSYLRGQSQFELQFFHAGFLYDRVIKFSTVENGTSKDVPFDPKWYNYTQFPKPLPPYPAGMNFAGLRVHYPLHSQQYKDELLVFLGASYFKFLGRGQKYGLSARGLALDTGLPKGEEFPFFKEFWMIKPAENSHELTMFALLDSPSITGAYSFIVRPGTESEIEIRAVLFPRVEIGKLGVAPLTSMYFYGEDGQRKEDNFRPEVHDSDGLLLHTGAGEWAWRPLVNRKWVNITSYFDGNPRGFGLIQRDRDFLHYQDLEAFYHARPSYWVEPIGNWGVGHVELVEIPTENETNDNIVAYWVPQKSPKPGDVLDYSYKVISKLSDTNLGRAGKTFSTRIGSAKRPGIDHSEEGRLFVIDFKGGDFDYLDESQPVVGDVWNSSGRVENIIAHKNTIDGGWRLTFDFFPDGDKHSDFRAYLKLKDKPLTETWIYLWTHQ